MLSVFDLLLLVFMWFKLNGGCFCDGGIIMILV